MNTFKYCLSIAVASLLWVVKPAFANQCIDFYSIQNNRSERALVSEVIAAKLRDKPNGHTDFIISEILKDDLVNLQNSYTEMIEILSTKGKTNPVTWALESANHTLAELMRVSKLLDTELDKKKRQDRDLISLLSGDLHRCSGNISTCKANLLPALEDSVRRINEAVHLVSQLNERAADIELSINTQGSMPSLTPEQRQSINRALQNQKQVIENYVRGVDAALTLFKRSEALLKDLVPELENALREVARLREKGAVLKPKAEELIDVYRDKYPNFAKLFDQPVKASAFGQLMPLWLAQLTKNKAAISNQTIFSENSSWSTERNYAHLTDSLLYAMMRDMEERRRYMPHLESRANARDVMTFILQILRDPVVMLSGKNSFITGQFSVVHSTGGDKKAAYDHSGPWWSDLHVPLVFVNGYGSHMIGESAAWLADTIGAVRDEVQGAPKKWTHFLANDQKRYIKRLEYLERTYQDIAEREKNREKTSEAVEEISGVIISTEFPSKNSYEYTFSK